jgi:hypothetical protein
MARFSFHRAIACDYGMRSENLDAGKRVSIIFTLLKPLAAHQVGRSLSERDCD